MLENATRAIDGIIAKTQDSVNQYFQKQPVDHILKVQPAEKKTKPIKKSMKGNSPELPDGYAWVEMEDGKTVKMKIPQELL